MVSYCMSIQSRPSILVLTLSYLSILHQASTKVFLCSLSTPNSFPPQGLCISWFSAWNAFFPQSLLNRYVLFIQVSAQMPALQRGTFWEMITQLPVSQSLSRTPILFSSQRKLSHFFKLVYHLTPALKQLTVTKRSLFALFIAISLKYRVANKSRNTGKYMVHVILHVIHDKIILNMFPGCM